MAIQIILITLFLASFVFFIRNARSSRVRASSKMLLVLFIVAGVVAILDPGALTRLAHAVGVGRGTDLLLYVTVVAFLFVTMAVYLRLKDYEKRLVKLARHVALAEAALAASAPRTAGVAGVAGVAGAAGAATTEDTGAGR